MRYNRQEEANRNRGLSVEQSHGVDTSRRDGATWQAQVLGILDAKQGWVRFATGHPRTQVKYGPRANRRCSDGVAGS